VFAVREELLTSRALQITPLQAAVSTREPTVMQTLLDNGARPNDPDRVALICLARTNKAPEIEALLVAPHGATIDCTNVALPW
jgi:hypothetical protein